MKMGIKLFFVWAMVLMTTIATQAQSVGINSTGNPPNSSAMLDVNAANKGLLIPNVALTGTTNASPITSPAVSLLVYNTATTGDVTPGYYYNSGTSGSPVWTKLLTTTGTNLGDMQYWNGTAWVMVAVGQPGQFLKLSQSGIPAWTNGTVSDIDGNVYNTVTIGTQTWMAENLRTTKYRNGDAIPNDNGNWLPLVTGAYSWLNFDVANKAVYGGFYNWYAVADSRNIAPAGWHVPTDAEWSTLITYLGGESVAGGKLKEAGTTHWYNPNTGATNESGFTAFGGGFRYGGGSFTLFMKTCFWWSSTEISTTDARTRYMNYDNGTIPTGENTKHYGFCVRCIRD